FLDNPPHEPIVAGFAAGPRRLLVAKIVRFIDDDQIVISPINVRQIDVTGHAAVTRQVGVVEYVIVEAVGRQYVASIVRLIDRPIVSQPLWSQDKNSVVSKFVILDNGQGFEGFAETDAVGDDAAAEPFKLVNRADDAVPLKLKELFPNDG